MFLTVILINAGTHLYKFLSLLKLFFVHSSPCPEKVPILLAVAKFGGHNNHRPKSLLSVESDSGAGFINAIVCWRKSSALVRLCFFREVVEEFWATLA